MSTINCLSCLYFGVHMKRQSLHHTWIFSHSLMQEPKMLKCITELEVSINNVEEQQLQKQGFMKIDVDLSIDRTFSTKKGYCAAITVHLSKTCIKVGSPQDTSRSTNTSIL